MNFDTEVNPLKIEQDAQRLRNYGQSGGQISLFDHIKNQHARNRGFADQADMNNH